MSKMKLPPSPDIKTTQYGSFRGVDYSVDPSLVDKWRSPYAPNMISDDGGNPVKRLGWRILHNLPGPINGLFFAELGGVEYVIAHAGTTIQLLAGDSAKEIYTGVSNARSCAFYMPSTGEPSRVFDSWKEDAAYPKTITLPKGKYNIKATGGKGQGWHWIPPGGGKTLLAVGGKGGTLIFEIDLKEESSLEIRKIENGPGSYRMSYHIYVNGVLYAASGGGGDGAPGTWSGRNGTYSSCHDGGAGGGENGGDGAAGNYVIPPKGGQGAVGGTGGRWEESNGIKGVNGADGADYPVSTGGEGQGPDVGSGGTGKGGCGYAGGGGNSEASNSETAVKWWSGSAGGSSYLIKHESVTKIEDSRGTNEYVAQVKIDRKADDYQRLYILTGGEYLAFDGEKVMDMKDEAYSPTIVISRKPTGGGQFYESVNLITPKRTESFLGDSTSKEYQLTATSLDDDPVTVKIFTYDNGFVDMEEGDGFTVDRMTGKVTFSAAQAPVVAGQDNVLITYSKTVQGYADKIRNCTICTTYGVGGNNRAFVSGNAEYKAYDYWSDINRPNYFPDLNYAVVGVNNTAIMGYQKIGEYLSIVKEDNQQDTSIFLRSGYLNDTGEAVFTVKPGIAGIGAVSKNCFVNLGDEPLFLARMGIYATTSTMLSSERIAKNRSYFVDKKLKAEPGLENAVACEWNGYYLLAINNNVYLMDSRHKSGERNGNSDFIYECYHWTDVPARCWLSINGSLYFGTEDGRVCRFNTDNLPNAKMTIYSDGGQLGADGRIAGGRAIDAAWFTPNDDDGAVYLFKTLQKKGSLVTLTPYDRSSAEVCFVVDGNPEEFVKLERLDIFDWEDIDFERFAFNSNAGPQEVYFKKKKKKYKRLQIGIRNRQPDEGFGIHQIVKCFVIGNYSKNRGY